MKARAKKEVEIRKGDEGLCFCPVEEVEKIFVVEGVQGGKEAKPILAQLDQFGSMGIKLVTSFRRRWCCMFYHRIHRFTIFNCRCCRREEGS